MAVEIRQGDTDPMVWELGDDSGPVRDADSARLVVHGPKPETGDEEVPLAFDVALAVGAGGRFVHSPIPAHWADPGWYDADFVVEWADGSQRTFPADGPETIRVVPVQGS